MSGGDRPLLTLSDHSRKFLKVPVVNRDRPSDRPSFPSRYSNDHCLSW